MNKLFLLMLIGCFNPSEEVKDLKYVQDDRTGLCFATYHIGTTHGSFTNVPCTNEVLKQVNISKQEDKNGH